LVKLVCKTLHSRYVVREQRVLRAYVTVFLAHNF
jgi:hypothetical protein